MEFYSQTEGPFQLLNHYKAGPGLGQVYYRGFFRRHFEDLLYIVKHDTVTGEPWRDPKTGFCEKCPPGEAGEFIVRVLPHIPKRPYYRMPEESQAKILRHVFHEDDEFCKSSHRSR